MRYRFSWVAVLVVVMTSLGCRQVEKWSAERSLAQTREAEEYPYEVYPISEESKAKLCAALSLAADDDFCVLGTTIMHGDVYRKIVEEFPVGETSYSEVEAKLGSFPHIREAPLREDGSLISLEYAYGLTEYEGACVYFWIDLEDKSTVTNILASFPRASTGGIPTVCSPFYGSGRNQ